MIIASVLAPEFGRASSSGLNNIPTADTAPHLTLVIQGYSSFGARRLPDHFAAFKFGVDPWPKQMWRNRFELGLDNSIANRNAGPGVVQAKWATQPGPAWPAFSVGVTNLASTMEERRQVGEPFSFVIVSQDLKLLRLHGGYALQAGHNNTAMVGLDKSIVARHREFIIHADALQTDRQQNWAVSFGGMFIVSKFFALESWVTQPIHSRPPSHIVKMDLSFLLRHQ